MSRLITAFLLMFSFLMAFSSNATIVQSGLQLTSCPVMADDADGKKDKKEGEAEEEEPECD